MTSFAQLKRNRSTLTSKLTSELEKLNTKSYEDDRFWKIFLDKTKANGFAIIRLLSAPVGEDVPWQRYFSHSFKGPGGYFIENCPTTLGRDCPVCKANTVLWDTGEDENKKIARDRKRKLTYVSNILVVSDKKHPESEGHVFLYEYGKKIFDKISLAMNPEFEDKKPLNPFDLWEGADFSLRVKHIDGYWNYNESTFGDIAPIFKDDKKLEEIYNKEYPLMEFVDPKRFKTWRALEERFKKVIGEISVSATVSTPTAEASNSIDPVIEENKKRSRKVANKPSVEESLPSGSEDSNEAILAHFAQLAED